MKFASLFLILALAEARKWLPTMGNGMDSACFNQYTGGGTVLAQCGAPTTTQLGNNPNPENRTAITEFVAITDHSVVLETHSGVEETWSGYFSGFGSTNWGNQVEDEYFFAQAYTSYVGGTYDIWNPHYLPKSSLQLGYTSYFLQDRARLGYNQFFIGSPSGVNYYLPGCPNYEINSGNAQSSRRTSSSQYSYSYDYGYDMDDCPRIDVARGTYKFTILGLMTGTMINSLNSASPPASDQGSLLKPIDRDIAEYKTMR